MIGNRKWQKIVKAILVKIFVLSILIALIFQCKSLYLIYEFAAGGHKTASLFSPYIEGSAIRLVGSIGLAISIVYLLKNEFKLPTERILRFILLGTFLIIFLDIIIVNISPMIINYITNM